MRINEQANEKGPQKDSGKSFLEPYDWQPYGPPFQDQTGKCFQAMVRYVSSAEAESIKQRMANNED